MVDREVDGGRIVCVHVRQEGVVSYWGLPPLGLKTALRHIRTRPRSRQGHQMFFSAPWAVAAGRRMPRTRGKERRMVWLVGLMVLWASLGWAQRYQLTDFGAGVTPTGLNNRGEVTLDTPDGAFIWQDGRLTAIPPGETGAPPGVLGISHDGYAYGARENEQGVNQAFTFNGELGILTQPPDVNRDGAYASGRAPDGEVFGYGFVDEGPSGHRFAALHWGASAGVIRLPPFDADAQVRAVTAWGGVNLPVGAANGRAAFWTPDAQVHYLSALESQVNGVNNDALMCGYSYPPEAGGAIRPTCWDLYGQVYPLALLPGYTAGYADHVADPDEALAEIVGWQEPANGGPEGVVWRAGDRKPVLLRDLLSLPRGPIVAATGVNARGQIVGFTIIGRETHGWLLTPAD